MARVVITMRGKNSSMVVVVEAWVMVLDFDTQGLGNERIRNGKTRHLCLYVQDNVDIARR